MKKYYENFTMTHAAVPGDYEENKLTIINIPKIKVIYTPNILINWELDYIKYDIVIDKNIISKTINEIDTHFLENNKDLINSNIFVFSSNDTDTDTSYKKLNEIITTLKPLVIIHLSDEYGVKNIKYLQLSYKTKLYLRQYNFKDYNISSYPNTYQIPLGYMVGMLKQQSSIDRTDIIPINERKYTWAFIGNMKQDREELIDKFKNNFNNYYFQKTDPNEIYNIYNNSIFVPNGRGNITLDCLRLYEGALAGAIPVIMGNIDEIKYTFDFNNNRPPFIYVETWDEAIIKCKELLKNPKKLTEIQNNILFWWNNIIKNIRMKIIEIISPPIK